MNIPFHFRYLVFCFLAFSIFPLLPVKIIGLPVILFFSASILNFLCVPNKDLSYKKLLISTLPYLLFFVSALYSDNISSAFRKILEPRLSLLIIPLSFFLLDKTSIKYLKSNLVKFQNIFCFSTALICIIYFCYLPFVGPPENPHFAFPSGFFFKSSASKMPYWELEPVYFSFIIVIALIINTKLYHNGRLKLIYYFTLCAIFFSVLILLVSKIALIFISIFFFWFMCIKIKKIKQLGVFLILVILSIYPIYRIPSVRYEIEEIQYFIKGEKRAKDDTNDLRYRITSSSIHLAKQINPLIGTGIGDIQNDLNSVYLEKGYDDLLLKKHDTHNQYLSMFLGAGIIGLLGLLLQLFLLSYFLFKERQIFAMWIFCFFMSQMLTETVLERQIPVILFALFVSFMLFLLPGDYTEYFFKNKIKKSLKL